MMEGRTETRVLQNVHLRDRAALGVDADHVDGLIGPGLRANAKQLRVAHHEAAYIIDAFRERQHSCDAIRDRKIAHPRAEG